ncbi:MAG: TauD/TfdA family dioxygenase [Gammaproteobacteria bacterium]|nr:TauD/TfdA family dioxygenase [Gammaproteobacteria bacterium]
MSDADFSSLIELYYRHSMLLFRNQDLPPQAQASLAHRFGKPKIETRKQFNFQEHPEVSTIGNIKNKSGKLLSFFVRGGFGWHTDGTAACHVDAATFLYAVEVPRDGGDTLFLSTADAYDRVPGRLKMALENVSFLSSFHAHNDPLYESDPDSFIALTPYERDALPPVWHKVIQTHPVTDRKLFYLSLEPLDFNGIDRATGKRLLEEVLEIASTPDFVYRHRWQPGDLIIWDNHAMLHSGTPTLTYEDDHRLMHRSFVYTLPTERPLPNHDEVSQIFMPDEKSIQLADFET